MDNKNEQEILLEQTYRQLYPALRRYAERYLRQPSLAEEAVQETFRIACTRLEAFSRSANPSGWIMRTLQNVIRDTQRERARLGRLVYASLECDRCDIVAPPDDTVEIEYSDLLSEDEFRLIKLVVLEKYSLREAAEEFDISLEACKKRVQRAKEKLRRKLTEIENGLSPKEGDKTVGK